MLPSEVKFDMRGTVTKKKNRWYIVYYIGKDSSGKWKQKWEGSWDTKREAEKVLRSRIEEVENTFDRKADKSTLAVFLRHWLSAYCIPKLAPNTVNGYRVNVERHIIPYIGQIPLNKLTPANIQKLYADLLASGLSGTSVRYVHNNLHRALKCAVKQELISRNPADLVDPPRIDHVELRVLTPDESKALISGCVGTDIYLPVLLGLTLGLRRGEALGLQWDDIDMDAKTVSIIHSASFRKGGFLLSSTKTRNSRRTLIMPDALYIALKDARSKQQREAALFGDGYNPYRLVCCLPDGMPITSGILQHRFHDVLASCGLPSIRFHDLRHPYVKHTTKIFSLRLMNFQAQAYPDARRKTRGACQLHRGGQSQSPVRPLCNRKRFS